MTDPTSNNDMTITIIIRANPEAFRCLQTPGTGAESARILRALAASWDNNKPRDEELYDLNGLPVGTVKVEP